MNPYRFRISLRLTHPTLDPADITRVLGTQPSRAWKAGTQRHTPIGTALEGTYRETYWVAPWTGDETISSTTVSLEASLTQSLDRLETWRHFFTRMRNEGATIELFIGIFGEANLGIELPATLLSSLGSLGVALSLDIYPSDNAPAA